MPPADGTSVMEAQKRADPELKAVADFLRGKHGPKVRRGVLNGKRVEFFKGKTAVRTLMGPAYAKLKKVPSVKTEEDAAAVMAKVLPFAFFLRVDRTAVDPVAMSGQPKPLTLSQQQQFAPDAYFTWFYEGSPLWTMVGGVVMVAVMLAGVMFPLWPVTLRIGVWYLSVGALGLVGLFIVLAIVRLIFWCFTKLFMAKAIWMFPNLFEDVGFVDSFIPVWAYDEPKKKKYRKVGEKRSKKHREKESAAARPASNVPSAPGGADPASAAAEAASAPAPAAAGASSAAAAPAPTARTTATAKPAAATQRTARSATVEEAGDDE